MTNPPMILRILLLMIVIPAAIWDLRSRRVPNWITLAGVVAGIGLNSFLYEGPGLWMALKGMGLALLIYFPLYLLRGMGAGDAKLMAAVGAIVGPNNWLGILVLTSLIGAIAGLVMVARHGQLRRTFENIWLILMSLRAGQAPYQRNPQIDVQNSQSIRLPHAVAIGCGCVCFLIAAAIFAPV